MRRTAVVLMAALIFCLGGCAVPKKSTLGYVLPDLEDFPENTVIVDTSFDDCWKTLIAGLSSEFFVINNVEKASGLITMDFYTDSPEDYIDCGVSKRSYDGVDQTYQTAGDAIYKEDTRVAGGVNRATIRRETTLNGKINVHVSEMADGVKVSVNVRYVWTLVRSGTYYYDDGMNFPVHQQMIPDRSSKVFNTNSVSKKDSPGDLCCHSTGVLEGMILDIVSPAESVPAATGVETTEGV